MLALFVGICTTPKLKKGYAGPVNGHLPHPTHQKGYAGPVEGHLPHPIWKKGFAGPVDGCKHSSMGVISYIFLFASQLICDKKCIFTSYHVDGSMKLLKHCQEMLKFMCTTNLQGGNMIIP